MSIIQGGEMKKIGLLGIMMCVLMSASVFGVTVSIPNTNVDPGTTTVQIPINIDNAEGVAGFQFTVSFNNSVLNATGVVAGSLTSGWMITPNTTVPGQITVAGLNPSLQGLPQGVYGSLVILKFNVTGNPGAYTSLTFTDCKLRDNLSQPILSTPVNGSFTVNEPQTQPTLVVYPEVLDFGTTYIVRSLIIQNAGTGNLNWTIGNPVYNEGTNWITSINPTSGSTTSETDIVNIVVDRDDLTTGIYTAILPVSSNGGNQEIYINMEVVAEGPTEKTINIPQSSGQQGTQIEIPININNAEGVAGFQFTISFNNSVLQAAGIQAGSLTSGWMITPNTTVPGQISIVGVDPTTTGLGSGSGSLVKIVFNVVGNPGSTTDLIFTLCKIVNINGVTIPSTSQNGQFGVTGGTNVVVSIPNTQAASGTTVEIPININDATGIAGFQFTVSFNNSVLNATGVVAGSLTSGWMITPNTTVPGQVTVAGADSTLTGISGGSGSLIKLIFNVTGSAGSSTNLNFIASKIVSNTGGEISFTTENGSFTVEQAQQEQVTTPTFYPLPGTYTDSVDVTITCTTTGATIRYTTNGTEPTTTSTQYIGPIHLTATTTIKAKAFKDGMTPSTTGEATYTIQSSGGRTISIPASSGNSGSTIEIPININDATGIVAFQFTITFDNSVLQATGIQAGSLTSGWMITPNTTVPGQVKVAGINPSVQGLPGESGSLIKIVFSVTGNPGDTTNLNLTESKLSNPSAVSIPHIIQNGTFNVNICYSAYGRVLLQGESASVTQVALTLSGNVSEVVYPDADGNYSFINLNPGNYTITPFLANYRFNPSSRSFTITNSDIINLNFTGIYQCTLTINSAHDSPTVFPADNNGKSSGTGNYVYDYNTAITAGVTSPADETNGTRYICSGWTGIGSAPTTGDTNSTSFSITQNSTLIWKWTTEYKLTKTSDPPEGGIITSSSGKDWYTSSTNVVVTAEPNTNWIFNGWSGDLSGTINPTNIIMDGPKTITARFIQRGFTLSITPDILYQTIEDISEIETQIGVEVTSVGGFNSPVILSYAIDPVSDAITAGFVPDSITPTGLSMMNLHISESIKPDTYIVTVTGISNGIIQSIQVPLVCQTLIYIPDVYPDTPVDTQIKIPVMISNARGLAGFQFDIAFDPDILNATTVSAETEALTSNWSVLAHSTEPGKLTVAGFNPSLTEITDGKGCIVTIKVEKIGEIPDQGTDLYITEAKLSNSSAKNIPGVTRNGVLKPAFPGDLDRSGEVDIFDVILCLRQALEIDPSVDNADMNKDGVVDIFDVILVLRKALGID